MNSGPTSNGRLVSVIVPVYNREKELPRCIESVRNQSYRNIETLLVDDGSTDASGRICDASSREDGRIRVMHTRNNGQSAARNTGIKSSRGDFIFFIDSDDHIEKDAISLLIENYTRYEADITAGDFTKVRDGRANPVRQSVFASDRLLSREDVADYTRRYLRDPAGFPLFAYSWGRLFKSSIIKDMNISFDEDLRTFEDVAFNYKYLSHANKVSFCGDAVYNLSIHDDYASESISIGANPRRLLGYRQALSDIGDFLKSCDCAGGMEEAIGHAHINLSIIQAVRACGQINRRNISEIHRFIYELINHPSFRKNLRFYSPAKGNSRILPLLMRLRLSWPIVLLCMYKAYKRYGRARE